MFKISKRTSYKEVAEGIWGEFWTPAGRVGFLQTKARLGKGTLDHESRLTGLLSPVREVLPISKMNFNQLLQRDLDDHRVATKLVPYLLRSDPTGPSFFPPIMAVILPFDRKEPKNVFPEREYDRSVTVADYGDQLFEEWRYGNAYSFQRMVTSDGNPHAVKLGRLQWNSETAKLVVLDGQHRAMALLAIDRTLNDHWATGPKYRHFYEHRIRKLLSESNANFDISSVEFPVTICWFPDYHGSSQNPHIAARKLFVDVNKNARVPSRSRLILLSDTELLNIFTRSLLNRLRDEDAPLPLYVVEYDNPEKETSRPVRWSVLTNITMLRNMVRTAIFGPPKYVTDMNVRFGGRLPWSEMNMYMRNQLVLKDLLPNQIEEGDHSIERSELGNDEFPQENDAARQKIIDTAVSKWGNAILHVLGNLLPYKAHIAAVRDTYEGWITDDAIGSLARDAMFEGVGMFWTLRASYQYWQEENARIGLQKPEVAQAWESIQKKGKNFEGLRANYYLKSTNEQAQDDSRSLFAAVNTYACQVGFTLTLATLHHHHRHIEPLELARRLTNGWNATLATSPVASRTRHLIFSKKCKYPLNMLPKMDSPHAVHFRYFFLQLLFAEEAKELFDGFLDRARVHELMLKARRNYFEFLVDEKAKAYRRTNPSWPAQERAAKARSGVTEELGLSLKKWFEESKEDFAITLVGPSSEADTVPEVSDVSELPVEQEAEQATGSSDESDLETELEKILEDED